MGCVLPPAPFDLVNLLFDLERLQVVEFRFMGLELGMEFIFASLLLVCVSTGVLYSAKRPITPYIPNKWATYSLIPFEKYHSPPLIARSQIVASMVEFYGRDDVRLSRQWHVSWGQNAIKARAKGPQYGPSVISSTSPLSPKHLDNRSASNPGPHPILSREYWCTVARHDLVKM